MENKKIRRFKTISEFHSFRKLPPPEHPLISIINVSGNMHVNDDEPAGIVTDFYMIALKRNHNEKGDAKMKYGGQLYDFNEGIMSFISPNQVFGIVVENTQHLKQTGWVLLIHPDFLWHTHLAKEIRQYDFFDYAVNEALLLSDKEETMMKNILRNIEQEYHANIDKFSKKIIITHLENLLSYAERFYHRQFITREKTNHEILARVEDLLNDYFKNNELTAQGLPTVQYVSDQLHISPSYLSRLLKVLTGQTTQQHIHEKLIEYAKEKLSSTSLSVSEIAYELGFEHPQAFSRLFKSKTDVSPLAFRANFN